MGFQNTVTLLGGLASDLLIYTQRVDQQNESWSRSADHIWDAGGISTTAMATAKLGAKVALLSWIGLDNVGDSVLEKLKLEGVDIASVLRITHQTTIVLAFITPKGTHSRIVLPSNANLNTAPNEWKTKVKNSSVLHVSGFSCLELPANVVLELIELAHTTNCKVYFDPQMISHRIEKGMLIEVLNLTDLLTVNRSELGQIEEVVGQSLVDTKISDKIERIPSIVIRDGSHGVSYIEGKDTHIVPGLSVPVVNTLGAGDCFNGGLLYAYTQEKTLKNACILGNVMGALSVGKKGTASSVPGWHEIQKILTGEQLKTNI